MFNRILMTLSAICLTCAALAQNSEYVIEIKTDKKILNMDRIELAPTTPLSDLLQLFPELLSRGGNLALDNYDVQVNDVSMGPTKNNVLTQYKLVDVKSIEVSSKPSTSQQKNGQGGVIKIKLKDLDDGLSGSASLHVNTILRAQPGVMVNYQKDKWSFRSNFFMEYYHPFNDVTAKETTLPKSYTYATDSLRTNSGYESLNLDAVYKPDKNNTLHLWAMERLNLSYKSITSTVDKYNFHQQGNGDAKDKTFDYLLGMKYTHVFPSSKLETEWTFSGSPNDYSQHRFDDNGPQQVKTWSYDATNKNTKFTGLVKYTYMFVPTKPHNKVNLTIGANMNNTPVQFGYDFLYRPSNLIPNQDEAGMEELDLYSQNAALYLSPYIESDNEFGAWFLKAGLRYQYYNTFMDFKEIGQSVKEENYFTAFLNLGCQIAPHHHLSMILDRSVNRVAPYQTYPFRVYWPDMDAFCEGNPNLLPISVHNLSLNYITDFSVNDKYFTFDTELKYIHSDKLLSSTKDEEAIHYTNDGHSNIYVTNFLFLFSYKVLSLSFTANFFINDTYNTQGHDTYNYFNLSLVPIVNFGDGWNASVRFTYNSSIYTMKSTLSDYFYTVTRFAKTWDKITAYLQMSDNFHKTAVDQIIGPSLQETKYYNLYYPNIELGFHIKF